MRGGGGGGVGGVGEGRGGVGSVQFFDTYVKNMDSCINNRTI